MQRHIQSPKTECLKYSSSYRGWAYKIHIFIYIYLLFLFIFDTIFLKPPQI